MKKPIKIDMTNMKSSQIIKIIDTLTLLRKSLKKKGFDIKCKPLINK